MKQGLETGAGLESRPWLPLAVARRPAGTGTFNRQAVHCSSVVDVASDTNTTCNDIYMSLLAFEG